MRGNLLVVALAGAMSFAGASLASAQDEGFTVTTMDVGPALGLGGIGDASFAIGGRLEKAIKELPNLGNGILGIQGSVDYYHYDFDSCGAFDCDDFFDDVGFTYIPIAVVATYHFQLENQKLDPFFGVGLGYEYFNADCGDFGFGGCDSGGIYPVGRIGIRYYWRPKLALYADVGAGAGALHVGLMWKLRE